MVFDWLELVPEWQEAVKEVIEQEFQLAASNYDPLTGYFNSRSLLLDTYGAVDDFIQRYLDSSLVEALDPVVYSPKDYPDKGIPVRFSCDSWTEVWNTLIQVGLIDEDEFPPVVTETPYFLVFEHNTVSLDKVMSLIIDRSCDNYFYDMMASIQECAPIWHHYVGE